MDKDIKKDRLKILPDIVDNVYKGKSLAKYVFLILTIVTIARSLIHVFASDGGAQSIATIPLDTYSSAGAASVIMIFSLWGLSQALMGIVYGVVYIKYKSLISSMYVLLIIEYVFRMVIGVMKPITTISTTSGAIGNYILVPLCILMLILSLIKGEKYSE